MNKKIGRPKKYLTDQPRKNKTFRMTEDQDSSIMDCFSTRQEFFEYYFAEYTKEKEKLIKLRSVLAKIMNSD